MTTPRLFAAKRYGLGMALAAIALGQAGVAAGFAQAIGAMIAPSHGDYRLASALSLGLALAIGLLMLAERWMAERFAQSFVVDWRASIFEGVIRHRGEGNESRWLTALIGDLTALRNYAVRGSVKLWTSLVSGLAAGIWFLWFSPRLGLAMLPFVVGLAMIVATTALLRRAIAAQRGARGRLNRFLVRRIRIEMHAGACPRGHGRKRLDTLSDELRARIERRAVIFGGMELVAAVAGNCAVILAIMLYARSHSPAEIIGQISLIGFIASRLIETTRALHAQAGGKIARERLMKMLSKTSPPIPTQQAMPA